MAELIELLLTWELPSISGPDLSVWRPWAGSLLDACKKHSGGLLPCWTAGVVVCLEQGANKSMIYTLFFIPDYQFQKVFLYIIYRLYIIYNIVYYRLLGYYSVLM